jgi:hypothetical protein
MQNLAESDASVSHWQRMNTSWPFRTYNYFSFLHANAFESEINLNNTKNSDPTAQSTQCISITNAYRLMLFGKIISVYSENLTHLNGKMQNFDVRKSSYTRPYKRTVPSITHNAYLPT